MDVVCRGTPLAKLKHHLDFPELSKAILAKMPAGRPEFFQTIELGTPSADGQISPPEAPKN